MDINNQDLEKMASVLGDLEGKPEDEMISELANIIKTGQGGITSKKAKMMIKTVLPMMDPSQRRKLEKLFKAL
ncbi:MAG TPA: hypothetical protein VFD57_04115 [Clostridia bacterium]|nr:hypothetical protein [Clostridia bacterium]